MGVAGVLQECYRSVAGVAQGCYRGVKDPQIGAEVAPRGVEEVTVCEVRQLPSHLGYVRLNVVLLICRFVRVESLF
jgi:hypothetical protein